jgi:hypothetical protein
VKKRVFWTLIGFWKKELALFSPGLCLLFLGAGGKSLSVLQRLGDKSALFIACCWSNNFCPPTLGFYFLDNLLLTDYFYYLLPTCSFLSLVPLRVLFHEPISITHSHPIPASKCILSWVLAPIVRPELSGALCWVWAQWVEPHGAIISSVCYRHEVTGRRQVAWLPCRPCWVIPSLGVHPSLIFSMEPQITPVHVNWILPFLGVCPSHAIFTVQHLSSLCVSFPN